MSIGWVSIHRSLLESELWRGEKFTRGQAWVDLILNANHAEKRVWLKGRPITVNRGEQIRSKVTLVKTWKWNERTVSRFLNMLELEGMITQKSTNQTTHITICNYCKFQDKNENSTDQNTKQSTRRVQNRVQTNNNDNNVNNDNKKQREPKKIDYPQELNLSAWQEYIDYRKEAKIKNLTKLGEVKAIEKIIGFGGHDIQQQCINETIASGWQGIFEPKKKLNGNKSKAGNFLDRCIDGWDNS